MEDLYGPREFLAFYLSAGVVGNLLWGLLALWQAGDGPIPIALGASGAVMAVMVLCACHYPHRTLLLMFVLPVPYWLFVLILVGLDLLRFTGPSTGVAVAAHLAGAGFGFCYFKFEWRLLAAWARFRSLLSRSEKPRLRVYRDEQPVHVAMPNVEPIDEQLEAKADAVLEKVSREGMGSLTPEERDILRRASEEYKRRRN
jgi:hypothetical protein